MTPGELLPWIALYVLTINAATYLMFAWDKYCARNGMWRVSEGTLLAMAAVGGTIAAFLAAHYLRHKTRKEPFRTNLRIVAVAQALAVAALCVPQVRDSVLQFIQTNLG